MTEQEKEALLYAYIEFSNETRSTGPKELIKPIIIRGIISLGKTLFTLDEVQSNIYSEFNKHFDLLIIRGELSRLQNDGFIDYDKEYHKYKLIESNVSYNTAFDESKKNVEQFFRELQTYTNEISNNGHRITYGEVFDKLTQFIKNHLSEIITLLDQRKNIINADEENDDVIKIIEQFIIMRVIVNQSLLKAFEHIYNGILLLYIYENCPSFFTNVDKHGSKHLFLDTNLILRILGLQDELNNQLGKEFQKYVNDSNFTLSISAFTWEEIRSLIYGYSYNYHKFFRNGKVSHIYQVMKNRNVNPNDIGTFLEEINQELEKLNIDISDEFTLRREEYSDLDFRMNELAKIKHEHKCELQGELFDPSKDRPEIYLKQAKHDLLNVYNIIGKRNGHSAKTFEKEKYYFVTADYTLRQYIKGSMPSDGQSYVMGDSALAFLLYYKNPENSKGLSAQSFINAHFNSTRLSIKNWYSYYEAVKEKYKRGEISKEQVGYLLCKVIFDNEKFVTSGIDTIIDESLIAYEKKEKQLVQTVREKEELEVKSQTLETVVAQLSDDLDTNLKKMEIMQDELNTIKEKNSLIEKQLLVKDTRLDHISKALYAIIAILFIITLILICNKFNILASITGICASIATIYEVVSKKIKKT